MKPVKIFGKSVPVLALVLLSVVAAGAAGWILSNEVTMHVIEKPIPVVYTLALEEPGTVYVNEVMTFTGTLTATQGANVEGAHIYIYTKSLVGHPEEVMVSDGSTIADGTFSCAYTPDQLGDLVFYAGYETS